MNEIQLIIACATLFIVQIIILIKLIKWKEKKYLISILCLEIIPIIILQYLAYYYDCVAPISKNSLLPGIEYFQEWFICFGTSILYFIMLCITIITDLVIFRKKND